MTGQGTGQHTAGDRSVASEIRSVNNRGLKVIVRGGDALAGFESSVEKAVRKSVTRGSITVTLRYRNTKSAAAEIDTDTLQSYVDRLQRVQDQSVSSSLTIELGHLLNAPGVLVESVDDTASEALESVISAAVRDAITDFDAMRLKEGAAMLESVRKDCRMVSGHVDAIDSRLPDVVRRYGDRLEAKVQAALQRSGIEVEKIDLIREVQIYADRADISEEVTRLRSHIEQFNATLELDEPVGRKLDFIIQEMSRETNTIGSKAGDATIAAEVVEIKCALERIRELIQNLE